jgi:hypothetical protein
MNLAATPISWFWQAWLVAVVFVFPLPGTIALRNLLLLIGLIALLATRHDTPRPRPPRNLRPAAWGLVAITAWLALHSAAVAPAPTLALDNLRGDWIVPLLTAALAAYASARIDSASAVRAVVIALLAHVVWVFAWQARVWVGAGMPAHWPLVLVPFGQNDFQSSLNGMLFAILVADRVSRVLVPTNSIGNSGAAGWFAASASLMGDVVLRMRNGTIVTLLLISTASLLVGRVHKRFLALLVIAVAVGAASISLDSRWRGLKESLVVGWNSPSLYWQGFQEELRPLSASGTPVEQSAYARAAWAHEAIKAIAENPLGIGFGRDGFGRAVEMKYGYRGMVSSHSGWLDFALAAGIPGLALLLLTAVLAIRGGWRQFRDHDDAAGLMLAFTVGGYLLRCLLDGHFSGWRLGLFAFICGVLIAAMKPAPRSA